VDNHDQPYRLLTVAHRPLDNLERQVDTQLHRHGYEEIFLKSPGQGAYRFFNRVITASKR